MIVAIRTTAKCLVYTGHTVLRCLAFLFICFVCASLYGHLAHAAAVSRVMQCRIQPASFVAVQTALVCRRSFIAHAGLVQLPYTIVDLQGQS